MSPEDTDSDHGDDPADEASTGSDTNEQARDPETGQFLPKDDRGSESADEGSAADDPDSTDEDARPADDGARTTKADTPSGAVERSSTGAGAPQRGESPRLSSGAGASRGPAPGTEPSPGTRPPPRTEPTPGTRPPPEPKSTRGGQPPSGPPDRRQSHPQSVPPRSSSMQSSAGQPSQSPETGQLQPSPGTARAPPSGQSRRALAPSAKAQSPGGQVSALHAGRLQPSRPRERDDLSALSPALDLVPMQVGLTGELVQPGRVEPGRRAFAVPPASTQSAGHPQRGERGRDRQPADTGPAPGARHRDTGGPLQ
ncbi:hypothetical protein [Halosimplex salinum]|uniref:hypothetical protein n=1 Tax=Halosimplex salinum TaxID=1710538 RepID=UPI000F47987A|nr:hypothetical protein [Halosimplex salinum]